MDPEERIAVARPTKYMLITISSLHESTSLSAMISLWPSYRNLHSWEHVIEHLQEKELQMELLGD